MQKITGKIINLFFKKVKKVPLAFVYYDLKKLRPGDKGSYAFTVNPKLSEDGVLFSKIADVVNYLLNNYDVEELLEI